MSEKIKKAFYRTSKWKKNTKKKKKSGIDSKWKFSSYFLSHLPLQKQSNDEKIWSSSSWSWHFIVMVNCWKLFQMRECMCAVEWQLCNVPFDWASPHGIHSFFSFSLNFIKLYQQHSQSHMSFLLNILMMMMMWEEEKTPKSVHGDIWRQSEYFLHFSYITTHTYFFNVIKSLWE